MRPEILFPLFADAETLPKVGAKTARLIERACGGRLVRDLLFHAPASLIDRRKQNAVADAPDGEIATLEVHIDQHLGREGPRRPYRVRASDDSAFLTLAWFHAKPDWLRRIAPEGATRIVSGKVERFGSEIQMLHPDHIVAVGEADQIPEIEPVYPLTADLSGKMLRAAIALSVERAPDLPEWLDQPMRDREGWPGWLEAVMAMHAPQAVEDLKPTTPGRMRLAYDEILAHQLALSLTRARRKALPGRAISGDGKIVSAVLNAAPFKPTGAQERAVKEVFADLALSQRMTRLLHGDVGSGKTFVAALAAARAAEAGMQTAVMAPTEILARQHAASLKAFLEPAGLTVAALTGRDKGKARGEILERMAGGEIDVVCGTHALFQEGVDFADLGLAVVDEQHRFGVSDRMKLGAKGLRPDTLVMTATPIPRTLALSIYGDLDVSRLDEKPPGRTPVTTSAVPMERLPEIVERVTAAVKRGERVYWVCPLVEESDRSDLSAATDRKAHLETVTGLRIGLVHGQMKAAEKEQAALAFRNGETDILVATTVIEVGVDSPDATVMIIEHAERFGLAQLHQLRGRVGRSDKKSSCVLLYQHPLGETAKARLDALRRTEDGFEIAEEDWKLRGSGDLLGVRQSGLPDFKLVTLEAHGNLMRMAADDARYVVETDPELKGKRGEALRVLLYLFGRDDGVRLLRSG